MNTNPTPDALAERLRSYAGTCTGLEPKRIMIAAATRLEALQAQPVGERDREYWARVLHDAWPHTVISQALSELTGLPIGTVLSWDAVKEAGADCSGLYRFADAVAAALTASPPVVEREAIDRVARALSDASDNGLASQRFERGDNLGGYQALAHAAILALTPVEGVGESFQARVAGWMQQCFGPEIAADKLERNDRFIEESLELVQSLGYSQDRAHALVDYVFGRPIGDPSQEVGGVMVTLAALCEPSSIDMTDAAETELARILQPEIVAKIRAKQAAKPTGSALPISTPVAQGDEVRELLAAIDEWAEDPTPSTGQGIIDTLATLTKGARDAG
jgi:hypothetical protein